MEKPPERRRVWQSLPVITLVALALRLVAVGFLYKDTWNDFRDHLLFGFEIGRIARSLAMGHGYGNPMLPETGPTAWMTPVYPYLLAGVFRIFGIYSRNSALVILSFNALCSALTCIPIFLMAQRSFGRSVAVVACWIWALSPYPIYISGGFVWETCLSALLLAILFLWTLQLREHGGRWQWLGFGILWGISALTNASTLALFPFLAGWALYPLWRMKGNPQQRLAATLLVVFGLAIAVLPWQVRNYRTFHTPVALRDNFWLEFWVGNDGHSESWMDEHAHPSINDAELNDFVRRGEIRYMQEKRREALSYLAQHPEQFVTLSLAIRNDVMLTLDYDVLLFFPLGPDVAGRGLLEKTAGDVVGGRMPTPSGPPRVSCGYASTVPPPACAIRCRAPWRCGAVPAPVLLIHEEAGKPVGQAAGRDRPRTPSCGNLRQFLRASVLAPGHRRIAVKHQCGMRPTLADQPFLEEAVVPRRRASSRPASCKPGAPAAAPDTVMPLGQLQRRHPRCRTERLDNIPASGRLSFSHGCRVDRIADNRRRGCCRRGGDRATGVPLSSGPGGRSVPSPRAGGRARRPRRRRR